MLIAGVSSPAENSSVSAGELVRQTVQHEVKNSNDLAKYMFVDRKQSVRNSQTKLMVETREAMAGIVVAVDDRPLNAQEREAERARLQRFIADPEELHRKQKQEHETTERIDRIVKALPDAFLYEYAGTEMGRAGLGNPGDELVRVKFRPNPNYVPPTRVEQVLTGMQGIIMIDAQKQRIAQIDGTLQKEVSFGWGILGHLDRGGHFLVEQGDTGDNHWEITRMELTFTGKVLLFKAISIHTIETFSDFRPVPSNLSFAQGVDLLEKEQTKWSVNSQPPPGNHQTQ
jgi:hypothetical protein